MNTIKTYLSIITAVILTGCSVKTPPSPQDFIEQKTNNIGNYNMTYINGDIMIWGINANKTDKIRFFTNENGKWVSKNPPAFQSKI